MVAESMARVFEVVQVIGVIDNPFAVDFIIAHFHFKRENIIVHIL